MFYAGKLYRHPKNLAKRQDDDTAELDHPGASYKMARHDWIAEAGSTDLAAYVDRSTSAGVRPGVPLGRSMLLSLVRRRPVPTVRADVMGWEGPTDTHRPAR